jgi:NitT/TauT family transport system permease protein
MGAIRDSKAFAVLVLVLALIVIWYLGAVLLNWGVVTDRLSRDGAQHSFTDIVLQTWTYTRPVLPAPHQVAVDLWNTTLTILPTSKRSLLYHAWITLSATLLGFVAGTVLGVALAIFIVLNQAASRSLMPWIIASQTIPILAVAPVIVVLAYNFLTGQNPVAQMLHLDADAAQLVSKAAIATYLSFFPVVVGMVKGLRSPELLQFDLMRTYNATTAQTLWRLRWPTAIPFLFASMKVAVAASLVGAIVGELPTGAVSGLGARLLIGSYNGQMIQIWSVLLLSAILAGVLVMLVGIVERLVVARMGARPQ